jgi:integrase
MSDSNSTPIPADVKPTKPNKPYPDFPLTAHPAGQWCKKIRGKLHYFGPWSDPEGSLENYLRQKDDLHSGRTPRPDATTATIKELCNAFLNAKQELVQCGELSPRSWNDYRDACGEIIASFGKGRLVSDLRPDDFATLRKRLAAKWGPYRLSKAIQCIRSVFKHAYDSERIDRPIRFGPGFNRPSKKVLRLHRAEQGAKLFAAAEIRKMIEAAGPSLRAMILLGINCGFGNGDCGHLPLSAVNLEGGLIDYPRPKTGIPRRCCLWPETVSALREVLARRSAPKNPEDADLFFLTSQGRSWIKDTNDSPISKELTKLFKRIGINGRKGRNFYVLRHTHRTVSDQAKDQPAADYIMGHEVSHMSSVYREMISDQRLETVSNFVRTWLFPSASLLKSVEV